jgi:hypothetical protein
VTAAGVVGVVASSRRRSPKRGSRAKHRFKVVAKLEDFPTASGMDAFLERGQGQKSHGQSRYCTDGHLSNFSFSNPSPSSAEVCVVLDLVIGMCLVTLDSGLTQLDYFSEYKTKFMKVLSLLSKHLITRKWAGMCGTLGFCSTSDENESYIGSFRVIPVGNLRDTSDTPPSMIPFW